MENRRTLNSVSRVLPSNPRSQLERDFERFKRDLPRDFASHIRETYRIDLSARYLGEPIPHPVGKGSGQLSLNAAQLETDGDAGLAFVVLKTVIAQNAAGAQSMAAWAIHETKMKVERRSAGIRDLGHAYLRDEDWAGHDPERPWADTGTPLPLLASARHHAIAATVGPTPGHLSSRLFGDTLVLHPSAVGRGRRGVPLPLAVEDCHHLGGHHHFALLDHPAVYERLRSWLA